MAKQPALAAEDSDQQPAYGWQHPFAVSFHSGVRTPIGTGMAFEVAPVYVLALETGAGSGLEGPQFSLLARLRMPARSMAFALGAGLSTGPFRAGNEDCIALFGGCAAIGSGAHYEWNVATWQNFEISIDRRTSYGFVWRLYFGGSWILNPRAARCESALDRSPCRPPDEFSSPYFGISVGYAFSP